MTRRNHIPGEARYTGAHDGAESVAEHIHFTTDSFGHTAFGSDVDAAPPPVDGRVDWYDWRGLGDERAAIRFAERLNMPPLALEDALDVTQRPKYEERPGSFLLIIPHLSVDAAGQLVREQITLYWTDQVLLSLQEFPGDALVSVRTRIREALGRVRQRSTTYLAYVLADAILDNYTSVVTHLEERCDRIEDDILAGRGLRDSKRHVHEAKTTVNSLRRALVPLRDAVGKWARSDHPLREANVDPFLRDLLDNVTRDFELAEAYGTRTSDLYQLYTSELAVETNSVVQVLTVVSAIFIPLTFMAGIYGMNFEYIPELTYRHGYFVLWGVMITVAAVLLVVFRRRGWL